MLLQTFLEPFTKLSKLISRLSVLSLHILVLFQVSLSLTALSCRPRAFKSVQLVSRLLDIVGNLKHLVGNCLALGLFCLGSQATLIDLIAVGHNARLEFKNASIHDFK